MSHKIDYQAAGVDITKGYQAVEQMKRHIRKTFIPGVLGQVGGFGGLFALPAGYQQPVLVAGTDGVGTKLQLAFQTGIYDTIGIDCVAMCTNDIVCQGAKPLFFLDYIGTGKLDPNQVEAIVKGISEGCIQSECALIGGETAEMPGFYPDGEFDLAGFAVGVVEKSHLIDGRQVQIGDAIIGISASGLHSNGFSLVRKLIFETAKLQHNDYSLELGMTYGEALLTPTRIYVKLILELLHQLPIHAIAHITGGGWIENLPRILPQGTQAIVEKNLAPIPPIFDILRTLGRLDEHDMYNTFNMGIGMMIIIAEKDTERALQVIKPYYTAYRLGHVTPANDHEEKIHIV